jgi:predicted nucleotidyltransferase component of viral defense system
MRASLLSPFQQEVLEAFFKHEQRFYLSGGAALAGYHLRHRRTEDLDLFTTLDAMESGDRAVKAAAHDLGASVREIITAPDFRRRTVIRAADAVVVDLVFDRAVQGAIEKQRFGNVRVDPPEEILANKICTLLSRSEPRDLVDVKALEDAGFRIEDAFPLAQAKDGGLTRAQLAWVLSQTNLDVYDAANFHSALVPTREDLRAYVQDLIRRLTPGTRP